MKYIINILFLLFSLSVFAQTVTITSPTEGQNFTSGIDSDITVTVNVAGFPTGIDNVRMLLDGSTQTPVQNVHPPLTTDSLMTFAFTDYPALANMSSGNYEIRIIAKEEGSSTTHEDIVNFVVVDPPISGTATVTRDWTPVVMKGEQIQSAIGVMPSDIVGFKFESNAWVQVPIQIDEMILKDIATPYGPTGTNPPSFDCDGQDNGLNRSWNEFFYCDPNTWIGVDSTDFTFDFDDELVFYFGDTGSKADGSKPPNTIYTISELSVTDPLTSQISYLYLFKQDGNLDQSAGQDYVNYNFEFTTVWQPDSIFQKEDYRQYYDVCNFGADDDNPENSYVSTANYVVGFSSRSIEDSLVINTGSGFGVDILDRFEATSSLTTSIRNTDVYTIARGNHVNILDKVIRSIRSTMGTSSGKYNQLTEFFYYDRVDRVNDFRVHGGGANARIYAFSDFNSSMIGANFSNNDAIIGDAIDGTDQPLPSAEAAQWSYVESTQGHIVSLYDADTNSPTVDFNAFYEDDSPNGYAVTGIPGTYGASGTEFTAEECFDRRYESPECEALTNPYPYLKLSRIEYYQPTTTEQADAAKYREYFDNPVTVSASAATGLVSYNNKRLIWKRY